MSGSEIILRILGNFERAGLQLYIRITKWTTRKTYVLAAVAGAAAVSTVAASTSSDTNQAGGSSQSAVPTL